MRLAGAYQAVEALDVEREVAELQRSRHTDYFFLARNGRCRLSTLPAVYEPDTPANLDWLACRGVTPWPVVALYLHADKTVEGLPWGSVTLLDQQAAVEDVSIFSALYDGWDTGDRRYALDKIQDMSKKMGRSIEKNLEAEKQRSRTPPRRPVR